ncbi:ABC transporter permease [Ekhidna sp. To15]|uniref:ABC transporter permease n=1 Tax=Ekhidna sp. To15 TaxID=3395267 RepID=UPI003F51CA1D
MFNLEKEIGKWLKSFQKQRAFDEGNIREMELHLRDHIEDLIAGGLSEKNAFEKAVEEFGEVPVIAKEEYSIIKRKTSLRSILFTTMINNYFKTTLRSMMKNPLTSFINVFGLAVAIGVCTVVYAFIDFDYSIDRHHENENEIYLATFYVDRDGKEEHYGLSPAPLGKMLEQDFSSIEGVCRIKYGNAVVKYEDHVFNESIRLVDPNYLDFFTFPLKWGEASSLADVNSIIITESISKKYFGDMNPIGKQITIKFTQTKSKTFVVSGVSEKLPRTRALTFDFLINLENYDYFNSSFDFSDWSEFVEATLIYIPNSEDVQEISAGMKKYVALQNEKERDWAISSAELIKFKDLHFRSRDIQKDISSDSFYEARVVLPIIGIFLIALACFNYINIAVVSAAKRLKEIGIRKVIGANRAKVITQFLTENIMLTLFALVMGVFLAFTVMLPWFNGISSIGLSLSLNDYKLWFFLTGLLVFTGVVSGIYPALYISKFPVVSIFKGSVRFGKKNLLTKVFLAFQIILSCVGVTAAVMFTQNSSYQNERSWGYDQHGAMYLFVPHESGFKQLQAELSQDPNITHLSGSSHHLGDSKAVQIVRDEKREYEVTELAVDDRYLETMGLSIVEGSGFKAGLNTDQRSIMVNELFVENLGIDSPIGHRLKIDTNYYTIAGVVRNFHFNNFYYESKPTIFTKAKSENYRFLTVRAQQGKEEAVYQNIRKQWASLFPDTPFRGGYQEDIWGEFYEELDIQRVFTRNIAYIFILLTGLGLYGLVSLNVAGRIREFSIRKTLGAGTKHIAYGIINEYLLLSFIALVFGAPISYVLAKANLDMMYPDPRPFGVDSVIIAVVILCSVLLGVMLMQVRKVTQSNPVEGLKTE